MIARRLAGILAVGTALLATRADAATGKCDVSAGDYTTFTGADPYTAALTSPGVSAARCMKTIRTLGTVVEGVFRDGKGRYADELTTFGKLYNMWPGENPGTTCSPGFDPKPARNVPGGYTCTGTGSFAETSAAVNKLDWNWSQGPRYNPAGRKWCTDLSKGCFGGRCYDRECVLDNGTLKTCAAGEICQKGACVAGAPTTLEACTPLLTKPGVADGDKSFYNPWDALTFDLGGLANKVAIFAQNDHGPQPCESNEYTVYLTNNPLSREVIDDPGKTGADPNKWNRAKLYKIFTHGWIDNPACCDSPKTCDPTKCTLPKAGDAPVLEADSMSLVFTLPCGISFRYVATIAGYDGRSLTDPSTVDDCEFHSSENEIDAVAGLNDDESAICPDKDGDGFPSCACDPKPTPCDCNDDPAVDPNAAKYYPGAPQDCDGPQYSCAPSSCPTGTTCHIHQCLSPCGLGEYKCPIGFSCQTVKPTGGGADAALCVPSPCGDAGACPAGFVCKAGTCADLCEGVKCPYLQRCQGGKCIDPCGLIKCPAGQTCLSGACVDNCKCLAMDSTSYPCKGATPTCDVAKGTCVPAGCDKASCPSDKHCEATSDGTVCRGACEGVVCPAKQVCDPVKGCVDPCELLTTPCETGKACKGGVCIDADCLNVECSAPLVCQAGKCVDPSGSDLCFTCDTGAPVDEDAGGDATTGGPDAGPAAESGDTGGCGCRVGSGGQAAFSVALAALVLTVLTRRRRR